MARRVITLLRRVGVQPELAITGGISKNPGVVRRVEQGLGMRALTPPIDAQIAGALGAALFADALERRARD
jgi:benzoyl-CoA reductase subunit A